MGWGYHLCEKIFKWAVVKFHNLAQLTINPTVEWMKGKRFQLFRSKMHIHFGLPAFSNAKVLRFVSGNKFIWQF